MASAEPISDKARRVWRIAKEITKNIYMGTAAGRKLRGSRSCRELATALQYQADVQAVYERELRRMVDFPAWIGGKRILEVGNGSHLLTPLWLLALGAESAAALDKFRDLLSGSELRRLHHAYGQRWTPEMRGCISDLLAAERFESEKLRYYAPLPVESASGEIHSEFDLIVSNGVLGCVTDLEQTLRSCWTLLAPGGVMVHRVNNGFQGTIEGARAGELNHLTFSPSTWKWMYSNRGGRNRQPASEYLRLAEQIGFSEVRLEPLLQLDQQTVEAGRPLLDPAFRRWSDFDLRTFLFIFSARKST